MSLETRLDRLTEAVTDMDKRFSERMARLEGGFAQMNERMGNIESGQRDLGAALHRCWVPSMRRGPRTACCAVCRRARG